MPDIRCLTVARTDVSNLPQWRRQDFVTGGSEYQGGSEVWVVGSRVRSPPEADTFTAVHREFVAFGAV